MDKEIEARILSVDVVKMAEKIQQAGAEPHGTFNQRRYVYDVTPGENKWLRLRSNGQKATLAVKEVLSSAIDGTSEVEIAVGDFGEAHKLLEKLGYTARSYQENRRTLFRYETLEITIDEWPQLQPFVEIEGPNEQQVYAFAAKLGYSESQLSVQTVTEMYADISIDVNSVPKLVF